jgi:HD-GYP domain-containing protein (c-di-GMP phosphodiesterase class II)
MTTAPKASFLERRIKSTQARSILQHFCSASKAARFYPPDHPSFVDAVKVLHLSIQSTLAGQGSLVFNRIGKELCFGEIVLVDNSLAQRQMVNDLMARQIFRISFYDGVTREELAGMINRLGRETATGEGFREACEFWREKPFPHIEVRIGQPMIRGEAGGTSGEMPVSAKLNVEMEMRHRAEKIYGEGVKRVTQILGAIQAQGEVNLNLEPVREVAEDMVETITEDEVPLLARTCSKRLGWDTAQHAVNVSILSVCLGKLLGLSVEQLAILSEAALVHDIGTVFIPREILQKPFGLSPEEQEIFERHPVEGASLLSKVPGINGISLTVTLEHHLHYDGTGYPVLSGSATPHSFSRVVALCDYYDAALNLARKQEGLLPPQAVSYMWEKRGSIFDPILLKVFVQMVGIFPVGSLVRLEDGSAACVVASNLNNMQRPWVILVGQEKSGPPMSLMDTNEETGQFKHSIAGMISPHQAGFDPAKYLGLTGD